MDTTMLQSWAKELGFATMGVCATSDFSPQRQCVESEPTIKERKQLRYYPEHDYPEAKALLVLLYPYHPAKPPDNDGQLFIDSYYSASNRAYHAAIELEKRIQAAGFMAKANVSYPAKTAALRAGMGCIGDHSLLITHEYGTRVVIILVATDAIEPKEMKKPQNQQCLHCGRCEQACPVGAIDSVNGFHPERCLRNYMMEGSVVPQELRSLMGVSLIGCDRCQRACPMQPELPPDSEEAFYLRDFVTMDQEKFKTSIKKLADQIGRNTARPQRIRAQAALIAGTMKSKDSEDALRAWVDSDIEAVRVHAEWALEQIVNDDTGG